MSKPFEIDKNAFEVPEGYFGSFRREMEIKIAEDYIRERCGVRRGFQIPEGYFEEAGQRFKKEKSGKLIKMLKPLLSAAAVLVVALFVSDVFFDFGTPNITVNKIKGSDGKLTAKSEFVIDEAAEELIISEYLVNIEAETIAEYFVGDEIETEEESEDVSEDDLTEYLSDYLAYSDIVDDINP